MRRFGGAVVLVAVAAMCAAALASASETPPIRPNAAVDGAGNWTSAADSVLGSYAEVPYYLRSGRWANRSITVNGHSYVAGDQLLAADADALGVTDRLAWTDATRPTGANVTSDQAGVDAKVAEARRRGGWLPSLKTRFAGAAASARMPLQATAWAAMAAIGVEQAASGYLGLYELLTGSSDLGTTTAHDSVSGPLCAVAVCKVKTLAWKHYDKDEVLYGVTNAGTGTSTGAGTYGTTPVAGWFLSFQSCQSGSSCTLTSQTQEPAFAFNSALSNYESCSSCYVGAALALEAPTAHWLMFSDDGSTKYVGRYLSDGEFERMFSSAPKTAGDYTAYTGPKYSYNFTVNPSGAPATATVGNPGSQTDPQAGAEKSVVKVIVPAAGTDPATSPGDPGAPTTIPPPGGLDFGPISDLDPGCKFPFGFICYAQEVTAWFDVTPDAPVFSFDLNGFPTPVGDYDLGTYGPVDLNVIDDYMAVWRTLLSIVLWIGAVYWVAAKLLGFGAAGDPGGALDEVM